MKTPTIKYIHIPIKIHPLDLQKFKAYVDKSKFQEGMSFFKSGKVLDLKIENGRGKASLQVDQLYQINFQIHQHGSNVCCSCEAFQDWELLCSHLVATILFLNKEELEEERADASGHNPSESKGSTSLVKSIESWLSIRLTAPNLIGELRQTPHGLTPFEILFRKENVPVATIHLPTEYVPDLLRDRRSIPDLEVNKSLEKYRVFREKEVRAVLEAKWTRHQEIQLIPHFEIIESANNHIRYRWEILKKHRLGKNWIQWRNSFFPIPSIPNAIKPFFAGKKSLLYTPEEIPNFLLEDLPILKTLEEFETSPQIMEAEVVRHAPIHFHVVPAEQGWFYLDPRYGSDEYSISLRNLFEQESQIREKDCYLKQGNVWYEIQRPLFRSLRQYFQETALFHEDGNSSKMKIPDLLRVVEEIEQKVEGGKFLFSGDKKVLDFLKGNLHENDNYPIPKNLKGDLRPYQKEGFRWLRQLFDWGLNGILADDMGLGKTHQAMALLCSIEPERVLQQKSTLIICPTSVLPHWEIKLKEFASDLTYCIFHSSERQNSFQGNKPPAVVITTYGLLGRDPWLVEQEWFFVILDEAQKIKNPSTQVSKRARMLKADHRLALTGTPIENRLEELWTIFDFLMPGYLGTLKEFHSKYTNHSTPEKEREGQMLLLNKIRPFKVRRIKSQVLSDLPEKIENKCYVDLTREQIHLYKQVLQERGEDLKNKIRMAKGSKEIPYLHIFSVLTKLKQICDHPKLVGDELGGSGKYELLLEMLQEHLEQKKKVVIFSHFVKMIDLLEHTFREQKIEFRTLTGSTRDRNSVIKEFQEDPSVQVFLCSLLAGGLGIDLTACETVFHYDRWWNAAREDQATDRVHRIGQTRGVIVHKLITRGTLEEKIDSMISEKKHLADSIIEMDDGSHLAKLNREQLIELLTLEEPEYLA